MTAFIYFCCTHIRLYIKIQIDYGNTHYHAQTGTVGRKLHPD